VKITKEFIKKIIVEELEAAQGAPEGNPVNLSLAAEEAYVVWGVLNGVLQRGLDMDIVRGDLRLNADLEAIASKIRSQLGTKK
jgi:hypothetical protein